MMERIEATSPRLKARIAGVFYLLTFLTGVLSLVYPGGRLVANLIASASYVAVSLLFYGLFKPVNGALSLLAACISLVGCTIGALSPFQVLPFSVSSLVFFGFYCLLIGYLIIRSDFLPRILGVLMAIGGSGWLTFVSPPLADHLSPFNMLPGVLGEGALTLWLLVVGVNVEGWNEQAGRRSVA
jgi:uncharacterized protein DUF4386